MDTSLLAEHPIRTIKRLLNEVLARMDVHFDETYAANGRPSIPPERLLLAKVLLALYSIRSERQFCERLQYDLLFRCFLDLNPEEPTFDHSTFSQNQGRLLKHKVADRFFAEVVWLAKNRGWISDRHFSVDATLIESWVSLKTFKPKKDDGDGRSDDGNGWADLKGEKRRNDTHSSITDPAAKLVRKYGRVLSLAPRVRPGDERSGQGHAHPGRSRGREPAAAAGITPDARAGGRPKKITGHPLGEAHERFAQIEALKGAYSVRGLCALLGVSAIGYYRWRHAKPSARQQQDKSLRV